MSDITLQFVLDTLENLDELSEKVYGSSYDHELRIMSDGSGEVIYETPPSRCADWETVTVTEFDSLDKLASWAGWVSKASKIALERET